MKLSSVANAFNQMECLDAYTGELAFYGQLGLYDDTKRDSETAERRVISASPSITIPARRVIEAGGTRFIMGKGNPDTFLGNVIRVGYVVHEATHLASIQTLSQLCANTEGTSAWAGRAWVKNLGYSEQDSNLNSFHHLHFSTSETIAEGNVITFDGAKYIVRTTNKGAAGTLTAYSDVMPEPVVEMASFGLGSYDPITDTHSSTPTSARVVRVRWQSLFDYRNEKAPSFGPGDLQIAVLKSVIATPVGERVTLSDGTWMIASANSHGDVWLCRGVRHA